MCTSPFRAASGEQPHSLQEGALGRVGDGSYCPSLDGPILELPLPASVSVCIFLLQGERGPPGESAVGTRGVPGIPGERGDQVCKHVSDPLDVHCLAECLALPGCIRCTLNPAPVRRRGELPRGLTGFCRGWVSPGSGSC